MSINSNTQEPVSVEPPSILQQAVVEHVYGMLRLATQYQTTLDAADAIVSDAKQAVEDAAINYVIDSISTQDKSNVTKLANTAQGAVLLAAAKLMPDSVPGVMAMALPVKGLGGSVRAGEVTVAGAMLSVAEGDVNLNMSAIPVKGLAEIDSTEYARLLRKEQVQQSLAKSSLQLDKAVQANHYPGIERAAIVHARALKEVGLDARAVSETAAEAIEPVNSNVMFAQNVVAAAEKRFQLDKAVHIGDFNEIKDAAHTFQTGLAELYACKNLPVPGMQAYKQASQMALEIQKSALELSEANGQEAALKQQHLINLTMQRDALEVQMANVLKQPYAVASKALMDAAKTLAEETLERTTDTSIEMHY